MKRLAAALAAALLLAPAAEAQSTCSITASPGNCTATPNVAVGTVTVGTIVKLSLSADSATLTAPSLANFGPDSTATITDPGVLTLTVKSNSNYTVTLAASTALWTAPIGATKAAGDLSWGTSGSGPFTPISTTPATVMTGTRTAGTSTTLSYRTVYHWETTPPGQYSLQLTFTLTSP